MLQTPQYANVIGWLESQRVRRVAAFAEGGATAPGASNPGLQSMEQLIMRFDLMIGAFQGFQQEISTWQRQLEVNQNLADVERGLALRQQLQKDSTF